VTFDLLTSETGMRTLGLWVLEVFAMYATGGQTDRRTERQKQCLFEVISPFPTGGA